MDWLGLRDAKLVKDWADLECRRDKVFGERDLGGLKGLRGLCGWREDGDGGIEGVEVDVHEEDVEEVIDGGPLRRDQKAGTRCFFWLWFGFVLVSA